MIYFNHIFVGIGNGGIRIVKNIDIPNAVKVTLDSSYYLFDKKRNSFVKQIKNFFGNLSDDTIVWVIFEDKPINIEIANLINNTLPDKAIRLAYVLSPYKELVYEQKPKWANNFETVFYDSLSEFLDAYTLIPLEDAFNAASKQIGIMFSKLYYYLENQMLVNIDYADLFNMVKGGNIGILRILREVDFEWNWGIWDRGLISIMVGKKVPLKSAHEILGKFQHFLREKDIIWGVRMNEELENEIEILALLIKRWSNGGNSI
ncbi:hypothetical protein [Thermococcus paralvinellae]|uniref:Uncharacterized protein n=1 Tax=Thermococcus paralvinellae TaxID=582419 RepID=W0I6V9_9EURY|nr:hypothetical protein [Thermococcus paralvinellae]AHF80143.1 Hypothetical protein TES1_0757 [Thermococcus paralvinellae]